MVTPQQKHDKFVEAAMMIDCGSEEFSCYAVDYIFTGKLIRSDHSRNYEDTMCHGGDASFLTSVMESVGICPDRMRELRVMLLLFAAQMARTGDL